MNFLEQHIDALSNDDFDRCLHANSRHPIQELSFMLGGDTQNISLYPHQEECDALLNALDFCMDEKIIDECTWEKINAYVGELRDRIRELENVIMEQARTANFSRVSTRRKKVNGETWHIGPQRKIGVLSRRLRYAHTYVLEALKERSENQDKFMYRVFPFDLIRPFNEGDA